MSLVALFVKFDANNDREQLLFIKFVYVGFQSVTATIYVWFKRHAILSTMDKISKKLKTRSYSVTKPVENHIVKVINHNKSSLKEKISDFINQNLLRLAPI